MYHSMCWITRSNTRIIIHFDFVVIVVVFGDHYDDDHDDGYYNDDENDAEMKYAERIWKEQIS